MTLRRVYVCEKGDLVVYDGKVALVEGPVFCPEPPRWMLALRGRDGNEFHADLSEVRPYEGDLLAPGVPMCAAKRRAMRSMQVEVEHRLDADMVVPLDESADVRIHAPYALAERVLEIRQGSRRPDMPSAFEQAVAEKMGDLTLWELNAPVAMRDYALSKLSKAHADGSAKAERAYLREVADLADDLAAVCAAVSRCCEDALSKMDNADDEAVDTAFTEAVRAVSEIDA